jgi:hypothetical protein
MWQFSCASHAPFSVAPGTELREFYPGRCKLPILGPKALNDLQVALGQNTWLEELIARFDEIVLPDCWLVAGCIAQPIWPEVTKRSDLTHKRTNHELRPPYERHRAWP